MKAATLTAPRLTGKRTSVPWLFFILFVLVLVWLFQSNAGFALGVLVSACAVLAALESAYAGMYWSTALFVGLAMLFNPSIHFLPTLDFPIAALAIIALAPMVLLFSCRKVGPYVRSLPNGSRWWLSGAREVLTLVE